MPSVNDQKSYLKNLLHTGVKFFLIKCLQKSQRDFAQQYRRESLTKGLNAYPAAAHFWSSAILPSLALQNQRNPGRQKPGDAEAALPHPLLPAMASTFASLSSSSSSP